MEAFYQVVGRYVRALDAWEECARDVYTGPCEWGQLRDPGRLRSLQIDFIAARNQINASIRRATEITKHYGRSSPYYLLLDVALAPPRNVFLPSESQISDRVRMLINDVLVQTIEDIKSGYTPKATAQAPPPQRRRFQRLRQHLAEHLAKYLAALISAIGAIIAAMILRRS